MKSIMRNEIIASAATMIAENDFAHEVKEFENINDVIEYVKDYGELRKISIKNEQSFLDKLNRELMNIAHSYMTAEIVYDIIDDAEKQLRYSLRAMHLSNLEYELKQIDQLFNEMHK